MEQEDLINVAAFAKKLYNIVINPANSSIIAWSKSGDQFIIFNPSEFSDKILSGHEFSSSNYASFVRQLNMYNFHKIKKGNKDKTDTFAHKYFIRDKPSLLRNIKRKSSNPIQLERNEIETKINVISDKQLPIVIEYKNTVDSSDNMIKPNKQDKHQTNNDKSKINKNILSSMYSNFLKNLNMGKKKQDEIDNRLDGIFRQNLELIAQNKTLLREIYNKTEYTKTLEHFFIFILEIFKKKNDSTAYQNNFSSKTQDYFNNMNEKVKELILKDKIEQSMTNINNSNVSLSNNFPMIAGENMKLYQNIASLNSSPKNFYINHLPSPTLEPNYHFSNFDLFENNENNTSRKNSEFSMSKLLKDDYMDVTKSPQTSNNDSNQNNQVKATSNLDYFN